MKKTVHPIGLKCHKQQVLCQHHCYNGFQPSVFDVGEQMIVTSGE